MPTLQLFSSNMKKSCFFTLGVHFQKVISWSLLHPLIGKFRYVWLKRCVIDCGGLSCSIVLHLSLIFKQRWANVKRWESDNLKIKMMKIKSDNINYFTKTFVFYVMKALTIYLVQLLSNLHVCPESWSVTLVTVDNIKAHFEPSEN